MPFATSVEPVSPISESAMLWLLSVDCKTGILAGNPSWVLIVDCIRDNLIELCPNSNTWKLSPKGWLMWASLIAQAQ